MAIQFAVFHINCQKLESETKQNKQYFCGEYAANSPNKITTPHPGQLLWLPCLFFWTEFIDGISELTDRLENIY